MDKFKRRFSTDTTTTTTMHKSKRLKQQQRPSVNVGVGEDISTEILVRLPVKSILKFKSVSKLWLSIITSPRFRQTHASRHRSTAAAATGLFFKDSDEVSFPRGHYGFIPLDDDDDTPIKISHLVNPSDSDTHRHFACISSCNGLQLLKAISKGPIWEENYFISNPTTKECKLLPIPSHICQHGFVSATLAFDPPSLLGYKVVFLHQSYPFDKFQLEVYSSTTAICKAPVSNTFVSEDFAFDFDFDYNCGVFCNGAIHWLSNKLTSVVYFNVDTECVNQLPTPASNIHYFGESRGHLHLVNSNHYCFYISSVLRVYELKRNYSGWFLKCKVKLASIAPALPRFYRRMNYGACLSIIRGDHDHDSTMVLLTRDEWVEYNIKKKTKKRLCKFVQPKSSAPYDPYTFWFNTIHFIPTLTCL